MSAQRTCEECGTELPANAPQGLCPRCLVGMGLRLAPENPATVRVQPVEQTGDRIGRYKLLQKIGEGGMGVVYMAEQEEPIRRRVALKIIKLGMDTRQVVARFEAERQALALMDQPNIAKVLDAGATDTGRPYFVMELVHGVPITEYCDKNHLPTRPRLDLFIQVCHAIQHAHQKGVIHRDLKPSNILVTLNDGVPLPMVIDFGIAKATNQKLTEKTLFTNYGTMIGTPAYMSPEQAEMSKLDVDTRTDIYSLGVLLYELLTGTTPFSANELLSLGYGEMQRVIAEREPLRPSTRLSTMANEEQTVVAKNRSLEASALGKLFRGDLDWIAMKCLEKDRTRRYETANGLAADLQRHLNNEPVLACPPTKLYRFQKLVRRNKLAFAAGSAVSVALVLGVITSTLQAVRATRAEREQSRFRQQAEASQKKSETEAAKATAISDFLQQMLGSANPDALKGSEYTVRQLLDDFSAGLANQLKDQPEVEATVRATIGRAYFRLGVTDKAQTHHERALTLRRRIFGDQAEPVAETLVDCAWTSSEQGQNAKAEPYVREALEIYRKRGTAGQPVIYALWALQRILTAQSRFAEVEAVLEEALTIARKSPAVEFPEIASMLHGLADVENEQSQYAEAESLALKAVAMHRRLRGAEHPETAWALDTLGVALRGQQKLAEAEAACREALTIFLKYYPSGHHSLRYTMSKLEAVLAARGDSAAVEALYREVLAGQRAKLGNDSPAVAETLSSLAASLDSQGKQADAEKTLREAMDVILKLRGQELAKLTPVVRRMAELLKSHGKSPDAEKVYEEAIKVARQKLGETNLVLGQLLHDYGDFLEHENKLEAAAEYHLKSLPIRRAQPDDNLGWTLRNLGDELLWIGRPQEAEAYYREALALYRKLHQQEDINGTAWPSVTLGDALYQQHKLPEAEQAYRDALAAYTKCQALGNEDCTRAVRSLLGVLKEENKLADGEALCREILQLYEATGQLEKATEWKQKLADFEKRSGEEKR